MQITWKVKNNSLSNSNFKVKRWQLDIFVIQNIPNYNRFHVNCYPKATCNILLKFTYTEIFTQPFDKTSPKTRIKINHKFKNMLHMVYKYKINI